MLDSMLGFGHLVECTGDDMRTLNSLSTVITHCSYTLMTRNLVANVTVHWNSIKLWRNKEMIRISFIYSHTNTGVRTREHCTED